MEDNFLYVAALISAIAVGLFISFTYLNIRLRFKREKDKFNTLSIILASIFELIVIGVIAAIIRNVILNVYCYLFLVIIVLVLASEIAYFIYYLKVHQAIFKN